MTNRRMLFALFLWAAPVFAAQLSIIDSGVDYKHKDLAAKMWTNPNSSTTTEDGTTYQGDTNGWNFAEKNNQIIDYKYLGTFSPDCRKIFDVQAKILQGSATSEEKSWYNAKKADQNFLKELQKFGNFVHGTHVSGISAKDVDAAKIQGMKLIPTEPPGIGIARAAAATRAAFRGRAGADNPMAKMFLGFLAKQQATMLTTVGKYVKAVKGEVANGSFGTSVAAVKPVVAGLLKNFLGHEPTEEENTAYAVYFVEQIAEASKEFVAAAPATLFVFAAGNDGTNNDQLPTSPANVKADNTITVAATMGTTKLASFSNFGSAKVEVAAPGVAIESTVPGDELLAMSGTSMAAPFVTNVAGAVKDANPSFGPAEIKRVLMETVDVKDFLQGKVKTSGIVNKARAIRAAELSLRSTLDAAIAQARAEVADMPATATLRVSEQDLIVLPLPSLF